MIKKELIGWTINNKHYRLMNKQIARIMYCLNKMGNTIYFFKKKKKPKNIKKILVIRLDQLGDMVISSSFINTLKKNYPSSEITILSRKSAKVITKMINGVDKIKTLNAPWFGRNDKESWIKIFKFILKNYKKYDLSFDLHGDPRNILIATLCSKYSIGYGTRGFGFLLNKEVVWNNKIIKHTIERQFDLLSSIGLKIKNKKLKLKISKTSINKIKKILKKHKLKKKEYVLIQMSAGMKSKELSLKYWIKLINEITNKKEKIVIADLDQKKIKYLMNHVKNKKKIITLTLSLKDYISLTYLCKRIISVDTFSIHLAASFNKPIIGYYSGIALVKEWGPYSKNKKIYQKTNCKNYLCNLETCPYGYPSNCMKFR